MTEPYDEDELDVLDGLTAQQAEDDACPEDPGGQHFIGCGCETSDVLD